MNYINQIEHIDKKYTVLIVDDNSINIDLAVEILQADYKLQVALNGEQALNIVHKSPPDIILLDIMMPGMDGYEVCTRLKSEENTAKIPVIFATAKSQVQDETKGFECGAVDYITKPISPPTLKIRLATHLALAQQQLICELRIEEQMRKLRNARKEAVFMLGMAGLYNDDDTGVHIWRMADYARALAKSVLWSVDQQHLLKLAASMHDTGKIGVPDSILKKTGKLDAQEWKIMCKHSELGHKILSISKGSLFLMAAEIALYHHERWGGDGYPINLQAEQIPESARIVAIADVFDTLTTSKRPYREPWSVKKAFEYIADSNGHFEPRLAQHFLNIRDQIIGIKKEWEEKEKQEEYF